MLKRARKMFSYSDNGTKPDIKTIRVEVSVLRHKVEALKGEAGKLGDIALIQKARELEATTELLENKLAGFPNPPTIVAKARDDVIMGHDRLLGQVIAKHEKMIFGSATDSSALRALYRSSIPEGRDIIDGVFKFRRREDVIGELKD